MKLPIKVQRICQYCNMEFTALTTKTRYCSHSCNQKDYKLKHKLKNIETSNKETLAIKTKPIEELKAKEFLNVLEVSKLLNCSKHTVYRYIKAGNIKALNLGQRITRIKRTEIDKLFS
jgi:excisionase family DNA binding protein